jgi:TonB-dependent receptor
LLSLKFFLFVILFFLRMAARAQQAGSVGGVVVSTWDGAPLPAVVVTVRGTTLAAQTDATGKYILNNVPAGDQVLRFSKSGYASAVVTDVRVLVGQLTTVNGNLRPEFYEMEEYEITAEEFTEQTQQILIERQHASGLMDAIGSDQFSRLGVGDAAEAMAKVTGTTIVDGKFAVIRGLSDRYTSATLNGGEVPSADPYRKAVQLDLFPSEMIGSIAVSKTFTPDQPGGFTGGAIDIVTKSFPEKFGFKTSVGVAFNTESAFNDEFLTYEGGKHDWAGMDDGTRAEPSVLANIPSIVALDFTFPLSQYGNDPAAAEAAAREYRDLLRAFDNRQLGGTGEAPPLNHNFSFSLGNTERVFGRRLGWFVGASHERKFHHYEGQQQRYSWGAVPPGGSVGAANVRADLDDVRSIMEASWGGTVNLAYDISDDHLVGFTFLYTQNAEDVTRRRIGPASFANIVDGDTAYLNELHWTERNLQSYQVHGDHKFPMLANLEAKWLASLATTTQDEPDYRLFNFLQTQGGTIAISGSSNVPEPAGGPTRYFRNLDEENKTYKVDLALPFEQWHGEEARLKFGGYLSMADRHFLERTYTFTPGVGSFSANPLLFPNQFLSDAQLDYEEVRDSRGRLTGYRARTLFTDELANSFLEGTQEIKAGYAMLELPLVSRVRLIGGARIETTDLEVASSSRLAGTGTNSINHVDVLPAVGLIYEIVTNMNLRVHYAQTVARPTFREFSRLRSYDPSGDEIFVGNPNLIMSDVENYDVRWEWFRRPGEVLSIGGFYKEITAPIEKVALDARNNDTISFINSPSATVFGAEIEARTSLDIIDDLLGNFSVGMNAAYIVSEVENTPQIQGTKAEVGLDQKTRPLYDQSPYVINTDLTYDNRALGTAVTLAFNVAGERLYLVNNQGYDVYEQPAPQLDFFLTQRLGKHWGLKFSAKNLLNPEFERIYGKSGEVAGSPLYGRYRKGMTFGLSLGCEF